jgi:transcriptional regulator with XRE-family HTH domain
VEIADQVRKEREQRGWTQAELAGRVPIGQQTVSRWERGRTRPNRDQVKRLLELFELDPDQLEVWLNQDDEPSEGALPPARPLNPNLPIGSLTATDFERFCRSLVKALHPGAEVHRFGDHGDRQDGIDLYAEEPDGTITTYQCKRYGSRTDFGPAKVSSAMAANTITAKHHYILLTRTATPGARKVVLGNADWSLWDLEDIAEVIRTDLDLDARIQLVDRFFPNHREDFLGLPERGPWLTADEFFGAFDDRLKLLNHTWSLVGRQQDIDDLIAFSVGTGVDRLAFVIGPGGSGKSRLLRALVASLDEAHPELRVRFILPGTAVAAGLAEQLPDGRSLLIIDDAHETPALDGLLYAVAALRPEIRVIAASRPYGVARIRSVAQRANLVDKPLEIGLKDLSLPEVTALTAEVLQAEGFLGPVTELARNIAALTQDCPLATVIGARLVARGQIQPQAVASDQQFRDRLFTAFSEVLTGELCELGERDVLDRLLQFFALLQPLAPDGPEFDALLQLIVGQSHAELRRLLTRLEDAGVLIRRGGLIRLVPDVLADTIAEKACIDERTGQPTGYADELFDQLAGKALQNLLVNVGKLDWRLSSTATGTPGARLLDRVWAQMENHLRKAGFGAARRAILETIADVAYFQPERALELAAQTIHDSGLNKDAHGQEPEPDTINLIPALVPILRHVAYTYQYVGPAVDLLWTLAKSYRPAIGASSNSEPLRALQQIAGFGPGKPMTFHEAVIERALDWVVAGPTTPGDPSPFDVLDAFLATEGTEDSFDERQITMRGFLITADVVRPLRERVIDAAFSALEHGPLQDAVRALKTLEHSLRFPIGLAGAHPSDEQRGQWDPDHLAVLKRLADLVSSTPLEPLLYVEMRHVVRWHAVHGHGETQAAARRVLAILPTDLRSRVTRCLIEGFTWASDDLTDNYEAAEQHHQEYQAETADQLRLDVPDAGECVIYLTDRLKVISSVTTGRAVVPGPFLASLIERDPDIARQVIETVLIDPSTQLAGVLSVALWQLALTAPTEAVGDAHRLLALDEIGLDQQIAHAFSHGLGTRTDLHDEELALIESLAQHPDPGVRSTIVHAADNIAASSKARAVRFLLSIDFKDSTPVAAGVLGEFNRHAFSVDDLGPKERSGLLKQLEVCPSLDDYAIGLFLSAVAREDAEEMVAMLMARLDNQSAGGQNFEGIPWAWAYADQSPVILHDNAKFDRVLGRLVDWLRGTDPLRAHLKTPLVTGVVGIFDEPVIAALRTWLQQHPDRESLEAVSLALSEAERSVVWTQQAFVVELLEAAEAFDEACLQTVASNLYKAAISNSGLGTSLGGQAAGEAELMTNARRIMGELPIGSYARRFYRELADHAEHMIQWLSSSHFD